MSRSNGTIASNETKILKSNSIIEHVSPYDYYHLFRVFTTAYAFHFIISIPTNFIALLYVFTFVLFLYADICIFLKKKTLLFWN